MGLMAKRNPDNLSAVPMVEDRHIAYQDFRLFSGC